MSKPRDSVTDSACHVLKGAIVKILNTPLTVSVECNNKCKGRINVEYDSADKPSDDVIKSIQDEANRIIKENLEFKVFSCDRKEAEEKYKSQLVNNTFIYDKFPVPESVTTLTLVELQDWNINCCPAAHLKTTGEIGSIKIVGINHRPAKKELEFRFDIGPALTEQTTPAAAKGKKAAAPAAAPVIETNSLTLKDTNVQYLTQKIVDLVLSTKGTKEMIQESTIPQIEQLLTTLKNTSYANGFTCSK
ncbi:hypothetical protein CYY_008237 [Polysphondylium violaceum]|uniref:Threonyl/alanyl tRNA synthetase SAD domain-containing protein n=1 Tax=Polysphondylium violaceum TaxID=133409 RepID=A0A8J4V1F8_9MYCE|nr:hypothetical protein CYY_008237 [Polysphondylium violaceum]